MKLVTHKLVGLVGFLGGARLVSIIPWLRKNNPVDSYPDLSDEQLNRIHSRFDAAGWDHTEAEQPSRHEKAAVI